MDFDPTHVDVLGFDKGQRVPDFPVADLANDDHKLVLERKLGFQVADFESFEDGFEEVGNRVDVIVNILLMHHTVLTFGVQIIFDENVRVSINKVVFIGSGECVERWLGK